MVADKSFDVKSTVLSLWNGGEPLARTFWLYYFVVIAVLKILGKVALAPVFGTLALLWAAFMIKPIWVAADKYEGTGPWALVAKVFVVLLAIAVLGDLLA